MSAVTSYRLMGRPESGYSVKVRSALRFKNLPYGWLDRFTNDGLFKIDNLLNDEKAQKEFTQNADKLLQK